CLQYSNSPSTF
nr:immunoglobulin light chain junction region [Macaca mulatta]